MHVCVYVCMCIATGQQVNDAIIIRRLSIDPFIDKSVVGQCSSPVSLKANFKGATNSKSWFVLANASSGQNTSPRTKLFGDSYGLEKSFMLRPDQTSMCVCVYVCVYVCMCVCVCVYVCVYVCGSGWRPHPRTLRALEGSIAMGVTPWHCH